jgi:hypothetical protein
MYFDFDYYWRVVRHVWGLQNYPAKPRMLLRPQRHHPHARDELVEF